MNWIELRRTNGTVVLVNLALVRTIELITNGIALRYDDGFQEVMSADDLPKIHKVLGVKAIAKRKARK